MLIWSISTFVQQHGRDDFGGSYTLILEFLDVVMVAASLESHAWTSGNKLQMCILDLKWST